MSIASLILGILGLILSCIPCTWSLGMILVIVGLILGIIGLKKSKTTGSGKGAAIAGIICSAIGLIPATIWALIAIGAVAAGL